MNKSIALWAIVLFLSVDAVLFRLPVYCQFVKPHSFTGVLVQRCQLAAEKEKESAPLVAFLGDSRMREGFSAKIFDQSAADQSIAERALNLTVSGSTMRVWYYLLKHVDPSCNAFKMIVLGLPSYWDEDYSSELSNVKLDLTLSLPILKAVDTPEFVKSFEDRNTRNDILIGSVLKSFGYRRDVQDFVLNFSDRMAEHVDSDKYWEVRDYSYDGDKNTMSGVRIVDYGKIDHVPPHLGQAKTDRLKCAVFPGPPNPDFWKRHYLQYWLGRLIERYADSQTKIVLICVPNHPLPVQDPRPHISRTIASLAKYPNVRVLPEDAFASLNKPEYFGDDIHLNETGRRKFTEMLSAKLLDPSLLATRTPPNHTISD